MPRGYARLADAAVDEINDSGSHDGAEPWEDERESPLATRDRLYVAVGRAHHLVADLGSAATDPCRWLAAIQSNPYQSLDVTTDAEHQAEGESALRTATISATQTGAGALLSATGIPGISNVPGAINAAHTVRQAQQLYAIVAQLEAAAPNPQPRGETDADRAWLLQTIRNCAYHRSARATSQWVAVCFTLGAGIGVAGLGVALAPFTAGASIPAAAIAGAGLAASAGTAIGAKAAKLGAQKALEVRRAFNAAQSARTLVAGALDPADPAAQNAARNALKVLGLDLQLLAGIEPPSLDHDESPQLLGVIGRVKRLV